MAATMIGRSDPFVLVRSTGPTGCAPRGGAAGRPVDGVVGVAGGGLVAGRGGVDRGSRAPLRRACDARSIRPRTLRVLGPTTPSGTRPYRVCKRRTAAAVNGPKRPSTPGRPRSNPRRSRMRCTRRTPALGAAPRPAPCSRTVVDVDVAATAGSGAPSATAPIAIRMVAANALRASSQDNMAGLPFESAHTRARARRPERVGEAPGTGAQPGRSTRETKAAGRWAAGARSRR